jgi:nicotinamidase-related amidase
VLKPHRSGFYATPLDLLLRDLEARRLVVCGISTDMCVLSTVHDAILRGFEAVVARDACASFDDARHRRALDLLAESCGVASCPEEEVRFADTATACVGTGSR